MIRNEKLIVVLRIGRLAHSGYMLSMGRIITETPVQPHGYNNLI